MRAVFIFPPTIFGFKGSARHFPAPNSQGASGPSRLGVEMLNVKCSSRFMGAGVRCSFLHLWVHGKITLRLIAAI